MGVSTNRGTPKWMVYDGKPDFLMDDLGVPLFLETPIYIFLTHVLVLKNVASMLPLSVSFSEPGCRLGRKMKGPENTQIMGIEGAPQTQLF